MSQHAFLEELAQAKFFLFDIKKVGNNQHVHLVCRGLTEAEMKVYPGGFSRGAASIAKFVNREDALLFLAAKRAEFVRTSLENPDA